jgi:hypothetical protein
MNLHAVHGSPTPHRCSIHRRHFPAPIFLPARIATTNSQRRKTNEPLRPSMAELGDPILSLVSRVFLKDHRRIMERLTQTGRPALLCYTLQQIEQFRKMGEGFTMTHADTRAITGAATRGATAWATTRGGSSPFHARGIGKRADRAARLRELFTGLWAASPEGFRLLVRS